MSADIETLFRQWLPRINAHGISEKAMEAVVDELIAIERKIIATPATTASSLLCKAKIANHYRKTGWPSDPKRDMLANLVADLERLAGGAA
jgi:hypothetical protein